MLKIYASIIFFSVFAFAKAQTYIEPPIVEVSDINLQETVAY